MKHNPTEQVEAVRARFGDSPDVRVRELACGPFAWRVTCVYLEGLVDRKTLDDDVIKPLLQPTWPEPLPKAPELQWLALHILATPDAEQISGVDAAAGSLLSGKALLFLAAAEGALALEVQGGESRAVEEPKIESSLRGPRVGFVEELATNIALLRRTLPTPDLRLEPLHVGWAAPTGVTLVYLSQRAEPKLVDEVRRRILHTRTAAVLESRVLEEQLTATRWSPFPLLDHTERPDRVAAGLLEGRVAILTSGTPNVLLAPTTMWHLLQAPEDYYSPPAFGSFARFMRFLGMLAVLFMPAAYTAVISFHHEMLPTPLALSLQAGRARVPFPAVVEALILELVFEAIREAGLRLPRPAGQAIGIVGALLLGEAGIRAGLVSPMKVIIVAVTGMASFTIPNYSLGMAVRVLRFPLLFAGGMLGIFGVMTAALVLLYHLTSLHSFGVPYLAPLAPARPEEAGAVFLRPPWAVLPSDRIRPRREV